MKFKLTLLWLNIVMFTVFGLYFILAPASAAQSFIGAVPADTNLMIDMRATYGGLSLAVGLFLADCLLRQKAVQAGLLLSLLIFVCLTVARAAGVMTAPSPSGMMYQSLTLEVVMTILFALALVIKPAANKTVDRTGPRP
jgi:O-antigen ligase